MKWATGMNAGRIGLAQGLLFAAVHCVSMGAASAQTFVFDVHAVVPDDDASGMADVRAVPAGVGPARLVSVGLQFSGVGAGMYNGDLFVTLARQDGEGRVVGYAVLLNRVGARVGDPLGYGDSGIQVELTDASTHDIHGYRLELGGSHEVSLGGSVTGLWRPDGRTTDPALVLDTDPFAAGLAGLGVGDPAEGTWFLFASDLFAGRTARLDSWTLTFEPVPVPEPELVVLGAGIGLAVVWIVRRWARVSRPAVRNRDWGGWDTTPGPRRMG